MPSVGVFLAPPRLRWISSTGHCCDGRTMGQVDADERRSAAVHFETSASDVLRRLAGMSHALPVHNKIMHGRPDHHLSFVIPTMIPGDSALRSTSLMFGAAHRIPGNCWTRRSQDCRGQENSPAGEACVFVRLKLNCTVRRPPGQQPSHRCDAARTSDTTIAESSSGCFGARPAQQPQINDAGVAR